MDKVSVEQRSRNMAAVRSKNTEPEMVVRRKLHSLGLRFRLHQTSLPGSPDIVLRKHSAVVFVHGCFWHGHNCSKGRVPSSRTEFWLPKLQKNRERDQQRIRELRALGWRVLAVWECETKDEVKLRRRLAKWLGVCESDR